MWKLGHSYPEGEQTKRCKSPSSHCDFRHHINLASTSILEHMLDAFSDVLHLQRDRSLCNSTAKHIYGEINVLSLK